MLLILRRVSESDCTGTANSSLAESAGGSVSGWYEVMGVKTDFDGKSSPRSVSVGSQKGDEVTRRVQDTNGLLVDVTARIYVDGVQRIEATGNFGSSEIGMII